jgi:hypothetical protein
VAIRKLSETKIFAPNEKSKRLHSLQSFVHQVNGKKYKFDPMYLISPAENKRKFSNEHKNSQEEETYFCSSLVA